jgi:hypothetical protein
MKWNGSPVTTVKAEDKSKTGTNESKVKYLFTKNNDTTTIMSIVSCSSIRFDYGTTAIDSIFTSFSVRYHSFNMCKKENSDPYFQKRSLLLQILFIRSS